MVYPSATSMLKCSSRLVVSARLLVGGKVAYLGCGIQVSLHMCRTMRYKQKTESSIPDMDSKHFTGFSRVYPSECLGVSMGCGLLLVLAFSPGSLASWITSLRPVLYASFDTSMFGKKLLYTCMIPSTWEMEKRLHLNWSCISIQYQKQLVNSREKRKIGGCVLLTIKQIRGDLIMSWK